MLAVAEATFIGRCASWPDKQPRPNGARDPSANRASEAGSATRPRAGGAGRKSGPFRSALSMLTFYINRAGTNLPAARKKILMQAKEELRKQFGKN
jgi:hypothetical protein